MQLLSYQEFPFLSNLMSEYKSENSNLKPFIKDFPSLKNVLNYAENRNFPKENRTVLTEVLEFQYKDIDALALTRKNIADLKLDNSFTITTGHQLCLFTGPLYFIYKIASIINLTNQLKIEDPNLNFIPVFWMATEDHDFEEINHFYSLGNRYDWKTEENGGVGRMNPKPVLELVKSLKDDFGLSLNAQKITNLFEKSYKKETLSKAMQYLVNELFGEYGLVILDADNRQLKQLAIPCFEKEITEELVFTSYSEMENHWPKGYKKQVNARNCNLFYLDDNYRGRLIKTEKGDWTFDGQDRVVSEDELIKDLHQNPEKFSPNVLMRPMYQEIILPNLAYIGGGGELAYWFLLKPIFDNFNIEFPYLILRNSVINCTKKVKTKLEKSGIEWREILLSEEDYLTKFAQKEYKLNSNLSKIKESINIELENLNSAQTHLKDTIDHRKKEMLVSLEKMEKTLIRNWKRTQNDQLKQFTYIRNQIFPNGSFQERYSNFSERYLIDKQLFIGDIIKECNVFREGVLINEI